MGVNYDTLIHRLFYLLVNFYTIRETNRRVDEPHSRCSEKVNKYFIKMSNMLRIFRTARVYVETRGFSVRWHFISTIFQTSQCFFRKITFRFLIIFWCVISSAIFTQYLKSCRISAWRYFTRNIFFLNFQQSPESFFYPWENSNSVK